MTERLPETPTEFEVADIKPSRPDEKMNIRIQPSGRMDLQAVPLKFLIQLAYDNFDDNALVNQPKWLDSEKFDILAKASRAVPIDALRVMLRNLLAERFKLAVHTEQQTIQVYALVAGKHPKLEESAGTERMGCTPSFDKGMLSVACKRTTMAEFIKQNPPVCGRVFRSPGGGRDGAERYIQLHRIVDAEAKYSRWPCRSS